MIASMIAAMAALSMLLCPVVIVSRACGCPEQKGDSEAVMNSVKVVTRVRQSDSAANQDDVLQFNMAVFVIVRIKLSVSVTVCEMLWVTTSLTVSTLVSVSMEVACSVVVAVALSVEVTMEGSCVSVVVAVTV